MPPAHTATPYVPPVQTDPLHSPLLPEHTEMIPGHTDMLPEHSVEPHNSAAPEGSVAGVQGLADALLAVPEVDSGVVVKMEQVCMAGVTYGDQFRGSMSASVVDRIKLQLANADEEKNTIFVVTSDQDIVDELVVLAQQIRAGNVPAELIDEFDRLLRQALA